MPGLKPIPFAARADLAPGRQPNSIRVGRDKPPAKNSSATKKKGLRRRGSDAFEAVVAGPLLDRRSLVRRQRPAHTPWKILIPHSTMTMASTSVAAVSTLSKEATLILTLRFPAPLTV
jgi:hypothetical protein